MKQLISVFSIFILTFILLAVSTCGGNEEELKKLQDEKAALESQLADNQQQVAALQNQVNGLTEEKNQVEAKLEEKDEEILDLEDEIDYLHDELDDLIRERDDIENNIYDTMDRMYNRFGMNPSDETDLEIFYRAMEDLIVSKEEQLEDLMDEKDELIRKRNQLEERQSNTLTELRQLRQDFEQLQNAYSRYGETIRAELEQHENKYTSERQREQEEFAQQIERLSDANESLQKKIAEYEATLEPEEEDIDITGDLVNDLANGLANIEDVEVKREKDRIFITISNNLLFDSESDQLKSGARGVLLTIGDELMKYQDRSIIIEGHTDNVPISPSGRSRFESNWELSVSRATNVVHFLIQNCNMDPQRIVAAGRGEFHPVVPNTSAENRAQNRRVRIIVGPLDPHTSEVFSNEAIEPEDENDDTAYADTPPNPNETERGSLNTSSRLMQALSSGTATYESRRQDRRERDRNASENMPRATDSYREGALETYGSESSESSVREHHRRRVPVDSDDDHVATDERRDVTHGRLFDEHDNREDIESLPDDDEDQENNSSSSNNNNNNNNDDDDEDEDEEE